MGWKKYGVIEHDPLMGRTETMWYHAEDNMRATHTTWDARPIIEKNKAMYAETDERAKFGKGFMHHIGSIPMAVYQEWAKKTHHFKDQVALARLINDPENRHFLVRPVKL